MAVAGLALFFAIGGPSFAADAVSHAAHLITGKQIKDSSITTADVKNGSLLKGDFKAGQLPEGPQGPKGDTGPQGERGASVQGPAGSDAASAFVGRIDDVIGASSVDANGDYNSFGGFANPEGITAHTSQDNQLDFAMLSPNAPVVARDLSVLVIGAGPGQSITLMLRRSGTATPLQCTVVEPQSTCNSGPASATIPAGADITMDAGTAYLHSPLHVHPKLFFGWRATTP
jgi:hypothetical protein